MAHDLAHIWNDINTRYFGGKVHVVVRWSSQVSKRRWAVYKVGEGVIEINKVLDDASVPERVVAFNLYHEGLHTIIPADHTHHPPEFRAREQEFPGYSEIEHWMAANADRLFLDDATLRAGLDRYGRRYGLSASDAGKVVTVRGGRTARVLGWLPGGGDAPALLAYVDTGERFRISAKGLAMLVKAAVGESLDVHALPPLVFVENDPGTPVGTDDPFAGLGEATARELRDLLEDKGIMLLAVPHVDQATNYSCGAACLLAVLQFWGVYEGHEKGLYDALETDPKEGTSLQKLVDIAQLFGLRAEGRHGLTLDDLRNTLLDGTTAILLIQSGHTTADDDRCSAGHYVIVVGMDTENVYLMDPWRTSSVCYMPLAELDRRWVGCDGPGITFEHSGAFIRGMVEPEITRMPLVTAQLIEAKAIGTAQLYGQVSMRDLIVRHQGAFTSTLRSRIRQASTNTLRELRPVIEDAESTIVALLFEWLDGRSTYRDVQLTTAREWRKAYERVRDIGRRASAVDRHGAGVDPRMVREEEQWFRSAVREELTYWHTFLHEINEGQVSEERLLERLEAYLKAMRFMYEGARVLALPDNVLLHWFGPRDERNCPGCEYMLERSPFTKNTIPAVPRDGSTQCLVHCRHRIVVRVVEQADVQRRERVLPSRETMLTELRRLKHTAHGHRAQYVRRVSSRTHAKARNPFHDAPLPKRSEPFQSGENGVPGFPARR